MRIALLALLLAGCGAAGSQPVGSRATATFDIIIRNGDVIDGTGAPRKHADLGIRGDTIVSVGDLSHATATTVIDANGQVVTPGFIDLLGNSQSAVLIDPHLEGKVRQGITTEVTGEGFSPGPLDEAMAAEMERTKPSGWPPVTWHTLGGFMRVVEQRGIDAAIDEAIRIGREAKVPVNIFHLKIGGQQNWGSMPRIVKKIEAARKSGVDIAANIYPYLATSTELTSIVSAWALEGGYLKFVERLHDPATRARIANELRAGRLQGNSASSISIRGTPSKRLDAIAKEMNVDPAEAALRLFEANPKSPIAIFFSLSEDDMKVALVQPWVAFGSDSGSVPPSWRDAGAHPPAYATFTRVLAKYVRDEKLITLEECVRKMTSLAASRAKLADRGVLRPRM